MLYERRDLDCTLHNEGTLWAVVSVAAVFWNSSSLTVAGLPGPLVLQDDLRWAGSSVSGVGLLCNRPVSVVLGGSWIFPLSDTNSSVPAVAQGSAEHAPTKADRVHDCRRAGGCGERTNEQRHARGASCNEKRLSWDRRVVMWRWEEVSVMVCTMGQGDE